MFSRFQLAAGSLAFAVAGTVASASASAADVRDFSLGGYKLGQSLATIRPALEAKFGKISNDPRIALHAAFRVGEYDCKSGRDLATPAEIVDFNLDQAERTFPNNRAFYEGQRIDPSTVCIRSYSFGNDDAAVKLYFRALDGDPHDEVVSQISFTQRITEKPSGPDDHGATDRYLAEATKQYGKPAIVTRALSYQYPADAAWCPAQAAKAICRDTVAADFPEFGSSDGGVYRGPKIRDFMTLTFFDHVIADEMTATFNLVDKTESETKADYGHATKPLFSSGIDAHAGPSARSAPIAPGHPGPHAAGQARAAVADVRFDVVNAWNDKANDTAKETYYVHDTITIRGGNRTTTVTPGMFGLTMRLANGTTATYAAMSGVAPSFRRFDPSTNDFKLVPTVAPAEDLGALGSVSVPANGSVKVTLTFAADGALADVSDNRNVTLR